jgi:hypothetical protein
MIFLLRNNLSMNPNVSSEPGVCRGDMIAQFN